MLIIAKRRQMHSSSPQASVPDDLGDFTVETLGLVDAPTPPAFDSLTRLAMRVLAAPVALISIVQEEQNRQFFLSQQGLVEPWKSRRETPLSHSFCHHVKRGRAPLIVSNALWHPLLKDNLAITELDVVAYLGVPISAPDGEVIGALCVIENQPRKWTDEDLSALTDLANCVGDEITLRAALASNERAHRRSHRYSAMRESIAAAFMTPDLSVEERFGALLRAGCAAFETASARIVQLDFGVTHQQFAHDPIGRFDDKANAAQIEALTRLTASGCSHVHLSDLSVPNPRVRGRTPPMTDGCYLGTPLIHDEALYGVVEFYCPNPRKTPWREEDLSILSIISMLATAHLGIFGQIKVLKTSERALLNYISETGIRQRH